MDYALCNHRGILSNLRRVFVCLFVGSTTAHHVLFGQNRPLECGRTARRLASVHHSSGVFAFNCAGQPSASGSHVSVRLRKHIVHHSSKHVTTIHPSTFRHSAVCGRIETVIQGLPPPYILNKPKFALVTSAETRNQIKAPNFGINWTVGCKQQVEVVNSLTGKTINGKVSRITKQAFFAKYAAIIKRLPNIAVRSVRGDYGETKLAVKDYQVRETSSEWNYPCLVVYRDIVLRMKGRSFV